MFEREELHRGIFFSGIDGKKFKTSCLNINLILPLTHQDVCKNAMLPYMLRRGFKGCPNKQKFNEMLMDLYGADMQASSFNFGDKQIITVSIEFINGEFVNEKDMATKAIKLLLSVVFEPIMDDNKLFPEENFREHQRELTNEILLELNDKRSYAINKCNELAFEGTNCEIPANGTVEGVAALSRQDVSAAYFHLLESAQIEIVCIGHESDIIAAKNSCKEAFGCIAVAERFKIEPQSFDFRSRLREESVQMDVVQTKLVLCFISKVPRNLKNNVVALVLSEIYGGSPTSKLFLNVREKLSLCYYCASAFRRGTNSLCVDIGVDLSNLAFAKENIISEFTAMQNGDFGEEDIRTAQRELKSAFKSFTDSMDDMLRYRVVGALDLTHASLEEYMAIVGDITKEDIVARAKNFELTTAYALKGGCEID
ncbi:MAG: insulinase family protein [Oscillospiraceae bacterium]|jgi:predicted Zn-dependent peptidase|nr:insulinase family protein [Oscillospiraceae bacterium]